LKSIHEMTCNNIAEVHALTTL